VTKSLKIPKGVIRSRKSKKNRQHNGEKKREEKDQQWCLHQVFKQDTRYGRTAQMTSGEILKGCLETIDCYDIICKIGLWQYQEYYTPCTKAPLPPRFWDPSLRPPKPIGKPDTGDRRYAVERHFQQYFSYIVAVCFIGGETQTSRKSLTLSHNVLLALIRIQTHVSGDRHGLHR
jgi:hypothetical protein